MRENKDGCALDAHNKEKRIHAAICESEAPSGW